MSIYVFIYGTLRAGEINDLQTAAARRGLPAPVWVGRGSVPGMLVDFGDWPGLVPVDDGRRVRGDIYRVEPALIGLMDEIEEYTPGQTGCFVRRDVIARLCAPDLQAADLHAPDLCPAGLPAPISGTTDIPCQYYPIDPALRAAALDIPGDDWVAHRFSRTRDKGG